MQIIVTLQLYDISRPANVDEFTEKIGEIVDGKVLSPEFLIGLFVPDFSYESLMGLPQGVMKNSILGSWGVIFVAIAVLLLVVIFSAIVYLLVRSKREVIAKKASEAKEQYIWGGLIES